MPTVLLRIFLICHLLNAILLYFLPKRLRSLLPRTWLTTTITTTITTTTTHPEKNHHAPGDINTTEASSHIFPSPATTTTTPALPRPLPAAMDQSELKRVFQMFDRNGDGRITKKEMSDSLEKLGICIPDMDLAAMIERIDSNGDGCVDIGEFGELYQTIMDERREEEEEEEDMREAFNVFDKNGDGFITVEELRSVLASLGLKQGRTVEDCRRMIRKVDVDGDEMVNFKEFKHMMMGGGFAALR